MAWPMDSQFKRIKPPREKPTATTVTYLHLLPNLQKVCSEKIRDALVPIGILQLLLQACGREDGDEVQHGSRWLAITANDADVNWLNHKRCGEKSKMLSVSTWNKCSIPHMQDPHPTDPHVIRSKQRTFPSRSKNVDAWHPNSQNPLLPAPELFAVSDPKQKCRTKPGMEDCFSSLFPAPVKSLKSVSQALTQRCFCFKNSPTTNLKQGKSNKNLVSLVNIHIHLEVQTNQNSEFQLEPQKKTWVNQNHTISTSTIYSFDLFHPQFLDLSFTAMAKAATSLVSIQLAPHLESDKVRRIYAMENPWHPTAWPNEIWYEDVWGKYRKIVTSHFEVSIFWSSGC